MMRKSVLPILILLSFIVAGCAVPLSQINDEKRQGTILLKIEPDNAKVFLDGIYVGKVKSFSNPKRPMKVDIGMHVLEFELKGYMSELRQVSTPPGGEQVTLDMQLRPIDPDDPAGKKKKKKKKPGESKWYF